LTNYSAFYNSQTGSNAPPIKTAASTPDERQPPMLRSTLAALFLAGIALPAFASYTFETAEPVSKKRVIAESVVWTCEDTVCTGDLKRKAPTVRVCKKIAKEVGPVTAFRNTVAELSAEDLAECNTAARK